MSAYIYTIHDVYVGSTTNLKRRLSEHKTNLIIHQKEHYNQKIYKYIRENGLGIEMKVIDTCPIDEQYIREQEWMDKLQYECNDSRAYTSPEQKKYLQNCILHNIILIIKRKGMHMENNISWITKNILNNIENNIILIIKIN